MRIACVGGGPGGLFLALLLARTGQCQVDVFDRDPEEATYGFGVVLSRLSVARLRSIARDVMDDILDSGVRWQSVEVRVPGRSVISSGHPFGAVERRALLRVLRRHVSAAGARLFPSSPIRSPALLAQYDVVVAADGANSSLRTQLAAELRPTVTYGSARYAWFGVNRAFECMTFLLANGADGPVGAHVYPYSHSASTFLVEIPHEVWNKAGFGDNVPHTPGWTDQRALSYCQEVFARDLCGATLIGNGSRWLTFGEVRNARWSTQRVVLLGDAAHTAHFSVGSGTSMAMEDAAELARCLMRHPVIGDAFAAYEAVRRPIVAGIQTAAWVSSRFWERLQNESGRDAGEVMLRLLTRTDQTDLDVLLKIDPSLSTVIHRIPYPIAAGNTAVAVPWSRRSMPIGGPRVVLVEVREVGTLDVPPADDSSWQSVALRVDWSREGLSRADEIAACLITLRRLFPTTPAGLFVLTRSADLPREVADQVTTYVAVLCRTARPDFVAVGCLDPSPSARAMQMTLCEFVRSELEIRAIYACPPGQAGLAWAHVAAARADDVWTISLPV